MQRRMYCLLFILLAKNLVFSQPIENISSQLDKIVMSTMKNKQFMISAFLGNQVYILQRVKDSLLVTSYATSTNNEIGDVFTLFVNNDTLFPKVIDNKFFKKAADSLCVDVKQNHNYKPYSKEVLSSGGNFFLTFYEKKKLQIFCRNEALPNQESLIDFILHRIIIYTASPFAKQNRKMKYLNVDNWKALLKYLKSGHLDSLSK